MIALTLSAVLLSVASASPGTCSLPVIEEVEVAEVADARSFVLTDGRRVKLAAVLSPGPHEPFGDQARRYTASAVARKTVSLAFDDRTIDRHGALVAHVFADGVWLQQSLIVSGLARVRTYRDTATCAAPLLADEAQARQAKRGLWLEPRHRVRNPEELEPDIGTFQIIEGRVASVATSRDRTFVNFGADYRTDFTVTISARDRRRLAKDGIDPATWAQKQVRVRGWLSHLNGPEVELTHAAQIQIIE
jgi:micrococcal nuclease